MKSKEKRILCYGDSNTWGYTPGSGVRYDRHTRWPGRLEDLTGYESAEEGLNGRTTMFEEQPGDYRNGLAPIESIVLSQRPLAWMIFMLGSNDTKWFYKASPEQIAYGMSQIIKKARACCAAKGEFPQVLLIAPPFMQVPEGDLEFNAESEEKVRALEPLYERLAEKTGCVFLRASDAVKEIGSDGVHMTAEGHRCLAEAAAEIIKKEPERTRKDR